MQAQGPASLIPGSYPLPRPVRRRDRRSPFAYVTFLVLNDSFVPGALMVAHALRRQDTTGDLVCLVTPEITRVGRRALAELYHRVIEVERIHLPHRRAQRRQHVSFVFTRLHALRLGPDGDLGAQYERIVLLDADVLPLRRYDHLFTLPPPAGIPNERKEHFVEVDARGEQRLPPGVRERGEWVWHDTYRDVCPHGSRIPREITDRVLSDPTNLGINGSVLVVSPSLREFREIMADLQSPRTRRLVTEYWEWPDQQYLTARWSGLWTSIDARFSGQCGYPGTRLLCGTHFAGVKPWYFRRVGNLARYARYEDFRLWYLTFVRMMESERPELQKYPRLRTLLAQVRQLTADLRALRAPAAARSSRRMPGREDE